MSRTPLSRLASMMPDWGDNPGTSRQSGNDLLDTTRIAAGPLMDEGRRSLFMHLCVLARSHDLHVAPEVSLGALFTFDGLSGSGVDHGAAKALRHKRVDFVLLDGAARPIAALDYRGVSEWRGRALLRDRLKRKAFEKAGIPLLEVMGAAPFTKDLIELEATIHLMMSDPGPGPGMDRRAA